MAEVGLPGALQAVLRSSWRVAITAIVAPFGAAAISGYGVATRLTAMLLIPGFGTGDTAGTLVGLDLASRRPDWAQRSAWIIPTASLSSMPVATAILAWQAPAVARWFNCTEDAAGVAVRAVRVVAGGYAFSASRVAMGRALDDAATRCWPGWQSSSRCGASRCQLAWCWQAGRR